VELLHENGKVIEYRTFPALVKSFRFVELLVKAELIGRSGFEIAEAHLQWLVTVSVDCLFLSSIRTPSKVGSRRAGYDEEGSLGLH
jgi:hypothetical protein